LLFLGLVFFMDQTTFYSMFLANRLKMAGSMESYFVEFITNPQKSAKKATSNRRKDIIAVILIIFRGLLPLSL
jgi:hypothetical protein